MAPIKSLKYLDPLLTATVLLLLFIGLAILYGLSIAEGGKVSSVFYKQLFFSCLGIILFFFFAFFDYHSLSKANRFFYPALILILILTLFFGVNIRGSKRWINLGFTLVQPGEFMKIALILGLSRLLALRRGAINTYKSLWLSMLYALIPATLIFFEPDFGTSSVLGILWIGLLLAVPIKRKFIIGVLILASLTSVVSWNYVLKDFQKDRIKVFLEPGLDPQGRGYNIKQAAISVGSGKLFGRGLGKGIQSQNEFLPEKQTDFVFAAAAEQVGFLGSGFIILLFTSLLFRVYLIAIKSKDRLGMYIGLGALLVIFTHVAINIGMNLGLLPVTGIPLPILSAGGSSLLAFMILLGIVQNVHLQAKILRF